MGGGSHAGAASTIAPFFSLARAAWVPAVVTWDSVTGEFRRVEGPLDLASYREAAEASRFLRPLDTPLLGRNAQRDPRGLREQGGERSRDHGGSSRKEKVETKHPRAAATAPRAVAQPLTREGEKQ